MGHAFKITAFLAPEQRPALEHLLYFNVNQERVREGIRKSIASYGVPEICERDGSLGIRLGSMAAVECLFAVSDYGHPLGIAIFARVAPERIVVFHLGVLPRLRSNSDVNAQVFLELVHEIHCAARRMPGVDRVEVIYSQRDGALAALVPANL